MKRTKIFLLVITVLLHFSCDDFLTEINRSAQGYESIKTEDGITKLLFGTFSTMRGYYGRATYFHISEFGSDLWTANNGDAAKPFLTFDNNLASSNSEINSFWNTSYKTINNANAIIEYAPNVKGPKFDVPGNRERIIAEARFLRALNYFNLLQNFGKIPLVLEAPDGFQTSISRSPERDVFSVIISDLRYASQWLPYQSKITKSEWGRVSRGAAQLLLARVYITRSSEFYAGKGNITTDIDSAIYYATSLIPGKSNESPQHGYQLLPDYADVFGQRQQWDQGGANYSSPYNQGNNEIVFALQFGPVFSSGNPESGVTGSGGNQLSLILPAFPEKSNGPVRNVIVRPSILKLDYPSFKSFDNKGKPAVGKFPNPSKFYIRSLEQGNSFTRCFPNPYYWEVFNPLLNEGADYAKDSRFFKSNKLSYKCTNDDSSIPLWQTPLPTGAPKNAVAGQKRFLPGDSCIIVSIASKPANYIELVDRSAYYLFFKDHFGVNIYPGNNKYHDEYRKDAGSAYGTREVVIMRLAEAYMIAGEAYGRKGQYTEALEMFNLIRKRAAYKTGEVKPKQLVLFHGGVQADVTSTESSMEITLNSINSKDKLIEFVLNERAREFAGEGLRWLDLQRTMKLVQRIKQYSLDENSITNIKDYHLLKPIPRFHIERLEGQVDLSQEQNEGYY